MNLHTHSRQPVAGFTGAGAGRSWPGYALAVGAVAGAAGLRWFLARSLGQGIPPYITFYPAIVLSAIFGGFGAGLLATVLSAGAVAFLFLAPFGSLRVESPGDIAGLILFFAINLMLSIVAGALHRSRNRIQAQAHELAQTLDLLDLANVLVRAPDDRIVRWNTGSQRLYGFTSEQALGKVSHELLGTVFPEPLETIQATLCTTGRWEGELRHTASDGRQLVVASEWLLRRDPAGTPSAIIEVNADITRRKQVEETAAKLAAIVESSTDAILSLTLEGVVTSWNPAAERLFGYSPAQILGHSVRLIIPPDRQNETAAFLERLRAGKPVHQPETVRQASDGRLIDVRVTFSPVRTAAGQLVGASEIIHDISHRKRAEEALRRQAEELAAAATAREEALAQLNALLANAPIGFAFFDREHRYIRINHFLADGIDGLPLDAHLGRRVRDVLPASAAAIEPLLQTIFASGCPIENVVITGETPAAPGRQRHWLTAWFPVKTPDGRIPWVGTAVMDITRQKRTEADLQRRNRHLQLLHQATAELLLGARPVEQLSALQSRIATTFGTEIFLLYQAGSHNGHLQLQACAGLSGKERQKLRTLRYGRAICTRPAEALQPIIATRIQSDAAPNRRFVRKLGWRSYLYYPLLINNRLQGTLAFASRHREDFDPTDLEFFQTIARTLSEALERHRLESELQRHAAELERTVNERTAKLRETVAELEGFSYSLVHDLRAPLRAMRSYAGILQEEAGPRLLPQHTEFLRKIQIASTRMDQLITDSLNYTRILRENLPLGTVNLGALLRGIVDTYPNLHPPQADVAIEFGDLLVYSNEAALTQVFSNLLGNAVKFVAPGVHPCVRLWAEGRALSPQAPSPLSSPGGEEVHASRLTHHEPPSAYPPSTIHHQLIRVCVQDNGIGIPKEAQKKIFTMFQRLHREDQYPGTGIGLALVLKSLERLGGRIYVDSVPGKGSCFCVDLPLAL